MKIINATPENLLDYGFCGYKDATKHKEMIRKADWFNKYYPKGLRIKILMSESDGSQGMIEYIPGEYAHRPVTASDTLFIHCLFVGYKREYKGQGYGSLLIDSCIDDARDRGMKGVSIVTRKGSFMAKREIFLKKEFVPVDKRKPDFELLELSFDGSGCGSLFLDPKGEEYADGLYILRSPQCPYTEKNVMAMAETARSIGFDAQIIDLTNHEAAQRNPSVFGSFALIYNGKVLSHHPVSNTRFKNIMEKL